MSVIWSGVTEEGAVVPVQVTDEGKVVAIGDGPQGDYLPITGGNLTGDLTLGTDEITLNADGSATFAGGEVEIRSSGEIVTNRAGAGSLLSIRRAGVEGLNIQSDGQIRLGGVVGSVPNITLNANGSAEFSGVVNTEGTIISNRTGAGKSNFQGKLNGTLNMDLAASGVFSLGGAVPNAPNIQLKGTDGSATFTGNAQVGGSTTGGAAEGVFLRKNGRVESASTQGSTSIWEGYRVGTATATSTIKADGSASFAGDVIIGSRGETWLIRESNGVAMLVQASREAAPMIPEQVRDLPGELDLIEMALNEVMEKLRMTPPAGWPVWDGSDNP